MSIESIKRLSSIWFYAVFGVLILALLVWTSLRTLQETPSREVSVQLPDQGWITFRLGTEPFPPLPTGIVTLNLAIVNNRGAPIDFGPSIPFVFGAMGIDTPQDGGEVVWNGRAYQNGIQFPTAGDYWLYFDLGGGKQVDFQVYVKPAQ